MANPLNLLPQALSQPQASTIYAEVVAPAPASYDEPLVVIQPDWTNAYAFVITGWPRIHGNAFPAIGAACLLLRDPRGNLRCVWWDYVPGIPDVDDQTIVAEQSSVVVGWAVPKKTESVTVTETVAVHHS